ncbi:hypothetical protein MKX03_024715 [Papaver bracteatum]|nr:hypothetical protein MKX03_024715 [Papaver bracteatum]
MYRNEIESNIRDDYVLLKEEQLQHQSWCLFFFYFKVAKSSHIMKVIERNFRLTVVNNIAGIEAGKSLYVLNVFANDIFFDGFIKHLRSMLNLSMDYKIEILWDCKLLVDACDFFEMFKCAEKDEDGFVMLDLCISGGEDADMDGGGEVHMERSCVTDSRYRKKITPKKKRVYKPNLTPRRSPGLQEKSETQEKLKQKRPTRLLFEDGAPNEVEVQVTHASLVDN